MGDPLYCAECGVELTTADADTLVPTDAGPVHRECFGGPVPVGGPRADEVVFDEFEALVELTLTPEEEEAENERRSEMGDPPLPPQTDEPAFTVGRFGSVFTWDPENGTLVNGQPYHPDEDGTHIPPTDEEYTNALSPPRDLCFECEAEPATRGGRGFLCRGRSMLP